MSRDSEIPGPSTVWAMALVAVTVPGLGLADSLEAGQHLASTEPPRCIVELRPAPIPRGEVRVTVVGQLSESIGELQEVTPQAQSGVVVSTARSAPGDRVRLTLSTTQATDGEWTITVVGETGTCTGTFEVGPRSP